MKTYQIRLLVWKEFTDDGSIDQWDASPIDRLVYSVFLFGDGWKLLIEMDGSGISQVDCDSLEHGKALAWEDWQKRILPALEEVERPRERNPMGAFHTATWTLSREAKDRMYCYISREECSGIVSPVEQTVKSKMPFGRFRDGKILLLLSCFP